MCTDLRRQKPCSNSPLFPTCQITTQLSPNREGFDGNCHYGLNGRRKRLADVICGHTLSWLSCADAEDPIGSGGVLVVSGCTLRLLVSRQNVLIVFNTFMALCGALYLSK